MPRVDEPAYCLAFSIDRWERLSTTQRIRTRADLADEVRRICEARPGIRVESEFSSAERHVVVLRGHPGSTLPDLIDRAARHGDLRMTAVSGLTGASSALPAVAEALRAFRVIPRRPDLPVRVVLADLLYHGLAPGTLPGFQRVAVPGFGPHSWLWPSPEPAASRRPRGPRPRWKPHRSAVVDVLGWEAGRRMRRGRYPAALGLILRGLRIQPKPSGFLALGACLYGLGRRGEALEVWRELVRRRPLCAYAHLLAGRTTGRSELARAHLSEGLRVVRTHPELSAAPRALARELLLALARLDYDRGEQAAGDHFVNEAAEADPHSPEPLIVLAVETARRGDAEGARLLLKTAEARASYRRNPDLLRNFQHVPLPPP